MKHFLTIPEEIYLLTLDEEGEQLSFVDRRWDVVLAGAILMDLALHRRIDTDLDNVIPDNPEPTNDYILDVVLNDINYSRDKHEISYWLKEIRNKADIIKDALITSLIRKGVLKIENQQLLWFFHSRKYPIIDNTEITEVRQRVRQIIFSDEIPDFRDIIIISLVYNGEMFDLIFTKDEQEKYKERIERLAKMDLVGQAISKSLKEMTLSVTLAIRTKEFFGIKTPMEELEELIDSTRKKFNIKDDKELPVWLQKGTPEYKKTLEFVKKSGTGNVIWDKYNKTYRVKRYTYPGGHFMD
jgi:golgi phosphoprotein 3